MPAESKHKSKTSGRCVSCTLFLLGVIALGALAISIYTLVKQLEDDGDDDANPTTTHMGMTLNSGQGLSPNPASTSPPIPDPRKDAVVACYPDRKLRQSDCENLGCSWLETSHPNVPSCVFDENTGYMVDGDVTKTKNGYRATLNRTGMDKIYGMNIAQQIQVTVETYGDSALRIHFAADNSWEIPDEALPILKQKGSGTKLYNVTFMTSPIFGVVVTRISTGAVVFNTTLPGLIFTDQFVQISTKLPSDNVYGFGEHNHRRFKHDMNWKTWPIFTRDVAPVDEWNLYGAHPVYMNLEDDSKASMVFLKNSHGMDVILQPKPFPAITYKVLGGSLDFYLFLGPSPQQASQQYTEAIGKPMMPPYWSLGFHLCRWGYKNLTEIQNIVERNLQAGIPQDGQWGDIDVLFKKFVFTVDKKTFRELPKFVDHLHDIGKKFIIILDPAIGYNETIRNETAVNSKGYEMYEDGSQTDIFVKDYNNSEMVGKVWPGLTVYPDFTNPNTSSWYARWIRYFRTSENVSVDGLWIDMNEPSSFSFDNPNDVLPPSMRCRNNTWNNPPFMPHVLDGNTGELFRKTICMDAKQHWGQHYHVHNLYAHSHAIATHAALKEVMPDKRPFIMTRSSFAGTNKYAAHWLGDNQSQWRQLPWSIVGMLEFSMFGFSMIGADICGFFFNTNYELCLRWSQVGAFYPFSRNHNARTDDQGKYFRDQDPGSWNETFTRIAGHALLVRYKMLPYYYTQFHEAHQYGTTVARSLMFEFPEDKNTWEIDHQFLIGPAFLVTPVLEENKRSVDGYFPKGRWFSYYDGKEIQSNGEVHTLDAPLSIINLHMRGGHIIPMQSPANSTVYSRQRPFSLAVNFDDKGYANGHLFWDDGESPDTFTNGSYLMVHFNATKMKRLDISVVHDGYPEARNLTIGMVELFGFISLPSQLYLDGSKISAGQSRFKFDVVQIVDLNIKLAQNHTMEWDVY